METLKSDIKHVIGTYLEQYQVLKRQKGDILHTVVPIIRLKEEMFMKLKAFISGYVFENEEEEIHFFKVTKPRLFSKLIYYQKVYKIETMRPNGSSSVQIKYIKRELDRLTDFFNQNLDFYKYFRSDSTYLDRHFFLRKQPLIHPAWESFYFERDPDFSSHYDYKIAKVLANELLRIYLNTEVRKLQESVCQAQKAQFPETKEVWTRNKTDLVELAYAICESNCFNDEKISLKRLVHYFENVFDVDLGNPYHTYIALRDRANRTQFLDELKSNLIAKMDADDKK